VIPSYWAKEGHDVVIDFAASWCLPCLQSIPLLVEKTKDFKNTRLVVVMLDEEWGPKQKKFVKRAGLVGQDVWVVWDKYKALQFRYKLGEPLPVSYISKDMKVKAVHEGIVDAAFLDLIED
jgi:thiol-disulfide isomerase/thioredoxin